MNPASARLRAIAEDAEGQIRAALEAAGAVPPALAEAMAYAVLGGGKRLRAGLVMSCSRLVGGDDAMAWSGAVAVEMIHAYSLVHDDLPCMDDDDLRRGRPTVHKRWGDAHAVLVGDALQTLAFEVVVCGSAEPERANEAARLLARAAGASGMVGGQVLDLEGEREAPDLDRVRAIHAKKTAALLTASAEIGAVLGGAATGQRDALRAYGESLGLAFQIVDDCLDETGTAEELGKSAGKDRDSGKQTWPACIGIEASLDEARRLIGRATESLQAVKGVEMEARFLEDLASFVVDRTL